MIFDIMSERDAIAFSNTSDILSCVIISITNPGDKPIEFYKNRRIKAVLPIQFIDSEESRPDAIQISQALKIAVFVAKWINKAEEIIVHCKEGVSRSAGVAAALAEHYNGNADEIFGDSHYCPNMRCYTLVSRALDETAR